MPVNFAHHPVVVKGYVDAVRICRKNDVIAEHRRLWEKEIEGIAFDVLYHLELLERKPGAVDGRICDTFIVLPGPSGVPCAMYASNRAAAMKAPRNIRLR